ncbi:NapC/NirT family cytochrome c [Carboxydothermus pertinax]|uniref:NapC/NirT family cytochrome c n=1 Tax=Carboxydothermus pertinax TaxID=870242 RepID=UPI00096AAA15|nr:NapC/NirT family cytochrome c [Carboxydothermus pertinax]
MKKKLLLTLVIAGIILLSALGIGIHETSKPTFCNTCHSMKPYVAAWKTSAHAKTDCMACHRDPGLVGLVKVKLGGLKQVAIELSSKPEPEEIKGKADVPNRRCQSCHDLNKLPGPTAITFSHELHAGKKGIQCVTCHGDLVHGEPKTLKMQNCLDCHKEKSGPVSCESCHQTKATMKPQNHDSKWLAVHGEAAKKDLKSCTTCHTGELGVNKYCNTCHNGLPMPHPQGWLQNHKVSDVKVCNTCHEKPVEGGKAQTCISCHQVKLPHPATWKKDHGKFTLQNKNVNCYSCHTKTECSSCHKVDMPHPYAWNKTHGATALAKGSSTCYTCHSKSSCNSCHTSKSPHNSTFLTVHSKKYRENPAKCNTCHTNKTNCNTCHQKLGHGSSWIVRHGQVAQSQTSCTPCHRQPDYCSTCHPKTGHDERWIQNHGITAKLRPESCKPCHDFKSFCQKCHA